MSLTAIHNGLKRKVPAQTSGGVPAKSLAPKRVDYEISRLLEREMKHSLQDCGNISLIDAFENRES